MSSRPAEQPSYAATTNTQTIAPFRNAGPLQNVGTFFYEEVYSPRPAETMTIVLHYPWADVMGADQVPVTATIERFVRDKATWRVEFRYVDPWDNITIHTKEETNVVSITPKENSFFNVVFWHTYQSDKQTVRCIKTLW